MLLLAVPLGHVNWGCELGLSSAASASESRRPVNNTGQQLRRVGLELLLLRARPSGPWTRLRLTPPPPPMVLTSAHCRLWTAGRQTRQPHHIDLSQNARRKYIGTYMHLPCGCLHEVANLKRPPAQQADAWRPAQGRAHARLTRLRAGAPMTRRSLAQQGGRRFPGGHQKLSCMLGMPAHGSLPR